MAREPRASTDAQRRRGVGSSAGPQAPPADFVAFVARTVPGLRGAAHALSGNDRLAESLVDDLVAATAVRWRWLQFTERRMGRARAADRYLNRIFAREARDWDFRRQQLALPAAAEPLAPPVAAQLAATYWTQAARTRRRRRLVTGGVAVVLLAGLCAAPRGAGTGGQDEPEPLPVRLPPLVDVLPAFADQAGLPRRETALPDAVGLDPARAGGWLLAGQVRRALAVFLMEGTPPMVLGDDGILRLLDVDLPPRRGLPPMTAASLAPDGTRVAFPGSDSVVVVDLASAKATGYQGLDASAAVVWLTPSTLLVSGPTRAEVLDPRTAAAVPTTIDARHVLTAHGGAQPSAPAAGTIAHAAPTATAAAATARPSPNGATPSTRPGGASATAAPTAPTGLALPSSLAERVIELLPAGEPATAPARVRRYVRVADDVAAQVITGLSGDVTGVLGAWRGPGFVVGGATGRAARDCDADALALPERYGEARVATVAVQPVTGRVERILVATSAGTSLGSMVLGWLDLQTALVHTSDGRTQNLLAWRVTDGELRLVATVNREAVTAVSDLTGVRRR